MSREAKKIEVVAWATFFIWVGAALLMDVGWGIGLAGVAAITLAGQAWRSSVGLRVEPFWLVAAALFAFGAVWELLKIEVEFVPVLLITAGVALLAAHMWKRNKPSTPASG